MFWNRSKKEIKILNEVIKEKDKAISALEELIKTQSDFIEKVEPKLKNVGELEKIKEKYGFLFGEETELSKPLLNLLIWHLPIPRIAKLFNVEKDKIVEKIKEFRIKKPPTGYFNVKDKS